MGSVADAAGSGDPRVTLVALRDRLASAIDGCEARELPGLAKQLGEVLRALAALPGEEKSRVDDLAAAREARRATVPNRASGKNVGGSGGG